MCLNYRKKRLLSTMSIYQDRCKWLQQNDLWPIRFVVRRLAPRCFYGWQIRGNANLATKYEIYDEDANGAPEVLPTNSRIRNFRPKHCDRSNRYNSYRRGNLGCRPRISQGGLRFEAGEKAASDLFLCANMRLNVVQHAFSNIDSDSRHAAPTRYSIDFEHDFSAVGRWQ